MAAVLTADVDQRLDALVKANLARFTASDFRKHLRTLRRRDAQLEAARMLREEPEILAGLKVHRFLEAIPGIGSMRVRAILRGGGRDIWPLLYVWPSNGRQRCMSERQLAAVASALERSGAR